MFRIKDVLALAKEKGMIKKNSDLANVLWCESTPKSAYMNLRNLVEGKTKKVNVSDVPTICKACGVSADYLFGLSDVPSIADEKARIAEKANELIELVNQI